MRISSQGPSVDLASTTQINYTKPQVAQPVRTATQNAASNDTGEPSGALDQHQQFVEEKVAAVEEVSKEKVQEAVKGLNKFMEINNTASKYVFHEGLDKYYVQMVDKETHEVVKEIPSEKLLDAFYKMQKLVGMIVDEKI